MTTPARLARHDDPVDTIVVALARALARQHHDASRQERTTSESQGPIGLK